VAPELKGKPGEVTVYDGEGNAFDFLRSRKAQQPAAVETDQLHEAVVAAAKTINAHHDKGDTSYNPAKLADLGSWKAKLAAWKSGTATQQAAAAHYEPLISQIDGAKGNTGAKVSMVTKPALPPTAALRRASATENLAHYINSNGGDWKVIEQWAEQQGGSSASNMSEAASYWLWRRMQIPDEQLWSRPKQASYAAMKKLWGDKYDRTWEMYTAGIQELLGKVKFSGNDPATRMVRILRTESGVGAVPFPKGQRGRYPRRVNASGSIFAPVFSGTRTITVVPHSRVTGVYFLERAPGTGSTFFYGDSENEFTYIGVGLEAYNLGKGGQPDLSPGTDSKNWIP
jgi:hypothetical protein